MKAREMMTANPVCVTPDSPARDAARLMEHLDCGAIPVVADEQSRRLVGIVTDRDIALRSVARGRDPETPVREVMSSNIRSVSPDSDLTEVERLMAESQVRRIPVVEDGGSLVGIIALADLAVAEGRSTSENEVGRLVERISEPTRGSRGEE